MNKKIIFSIALCFSLLLFVSGCTDEGNNSPTTGTNEENNNSENQYTGNELSENLTSSGTVAKDGKLIVLVNNNNDVAVDLEIEVEFYDENGIIVGSDDQYVEAVNKNAEVAIEMYLTPESFDNYKIYVDAEQSSYNTYFNDIELVHNNNGEEIVVQIKNNSQDTIDTISAAVVYYQGDEIVGIDDDLEIDIQPGRSANLTMYYPTDNNYDDVAFDSYKVFINEAYTYNW